MKVTISPEALKDLDEIWRWNARDKGARLATNYYTFLRIYIASLGLKPDKGKKLELFPSLRYLTIRRSTRGHGHVAVYEILADEVFILRVFHTAQDWQTKLLGDDHKDASE